MGTVYRKTFTKPLPAAAEVFIRKGERFARWRDSQGKLRTAKLTTGNDGSERIIVEAGTFTAKYRDGSAFVVETATGCRDETAARRVLGELERRGELVKSGVMTAAEDAIADHQSTPLDEHFAGYRDHQTAKGVVPRRVKDVQSQLRRMTADCGFRRLNDLDAGTLERWLNDRKADGMSAGTRNEYRGAFVGFCNWCKKSRRLMSNPFADVAKADANADRRRLRRAMTEGELVRLLDVARRRPLLDTMTVRRGKRKGEAIAELRPETVARLELLGMERALIYKTLVLTGLRAGELRSLTVGQLHLDGDLAYVTLDAADEKNRQGNSLPLRSDLAADLMRWATQMRERFCGDAAIASNGQTADVISMTATRADMPADTPLLTVPKGLIRILDRDLKLAEIAKRDERGRTLDVHALRTTFGTLLSKGGVTPRTAQAAMRHSTINLTMNTYTDPKLLDVHGAMDSLPALPLNGDRDADRARATGTDGVTDSRHSVCLLAPTLAPKSDEWGQTGSIGDKTPAEGEPHNAARSLGVMSRGVKPSDSPASVVVRVSEWAMQDSNLRHPRCKHGALTN